MKMKKTMQSVMVYLMILTMTLTAFAPIETQAATVTNVKVYLSGNTFATYHKGINYAYNGKAVNLGAAPILNINGGGYAPYTLVFVKNGPHCRHSLNTTTHTLILKYGDNTLKLKHKSKVAYLNGKAVNLTFPPMYVKYASTKIRYFMVPVNAVCKMLGLNYSYSGTSNTVHITANTKTQAKEFMTMSTSQYIAKMGPLANADYHKSGVLASVTLAQSIIESGWGQTELAQNANNLFGMKSSLSGNTWAGSAWDGRSIYTKKTGEYLNGKYVTITADFRLYPDVETSIADHSAYLTHAMTDYGLRYAGLTATKNYEEQLNIIYKGGYATSPNYVSELCRVVRMYNLTQWDY